MRKQYHRKETPACIADNPAEYSHGLPLLHGTNRKVRSRLRRHRIGNEIGIPKTAAQLRLCSTLQAERKNNPYNFAVGWALARLESSVDGLKPILRFVKVIFSRRFTQQLRTG